MSEAKRIALRLAYNGRDFSGWQRQPNVPSVQGSLETALTKLCKESIAVAGCSRTDAGVHALGHVSSFDTSSTLPAERLPLALSAVLPESIVCTGAQEVPKDFHARFSARGKQYAYYIWNAPYASPFFSDYAYHEPRPLNFQAMQKSAEVLLGEHDFTAFQAMGSPSTCQIRRLYSIHLQAMKAKSFFNLADLYEAEKMNPKRLGSRVTDLSLRGVSAKQVNFDPVQYNDAQFISPDFFQDSKTLQTATYGTSLGGMKSDETGIQTSVKTGVQTVPIQHGLLRIVVHGSGFLYNMMRIIVGTLLYAGLGKCDENSIKQALIEGNRLQMGKTLPAKGLCLERVDYDLPLFT